MPSRSHLPRDAAPHAAAQVRRIQRLRSAGWRMPDGAVYVGRPTRWGNPHTWVAADAGEEGAVLGRAGAVAAFKVSLEQRPGSGYPSDEDIREALAGRDLACWCPVGQPCHADVLLGIANRQPDGSGAGQALGS